MNFARVNGVTLHYELSGERKGRPLLVFINSLGTDRRIWDAVVGRLAAGYPILTYDKRGHGLSDLGTTPYAIADHAADLGALLDHLGVARAIVCGVSVGGQIALGLVAARPELVSRLILSDTAEVIGDAAFWAARIAKIEAGGLEAIADGVLERWFAPGFRRPDNAAFSGYRNMFVRQPAAGYIATCVALANADLSAAARGIRVPTLCVAGEADASTPPALVARLASLIPGARFETIAGAGHLPGVERPAAFAQALAAFLAQSETESTHVSH